jgi:lysozyme family protein
LINNYPKCLAIILKKEGGYVNDPHDAGGETNMGISKRAFPDVDIKNLDVELASAIYKKYYWNQVKADELPNGLDLVVFDGAVNSGPTQSAKWLQKALGIKADGVVGPVTLVALQKADVPSMINKVLDQRLDFLKSLSTWSHFGKGWEARVEDIRKLAHVMK